MRFLRYASSGISPDIKRIDDIFNGNNSISLPNVTYQQLAKKRSEDDPDYFKLQENEKPSLTNMLFGYYG